MADSAYDYIVVGAGAAGCVLANRLSADGDISVLLLEAGGPDRHPNVRIPAAFSKLFRTKYDWNYATDPEPHLDGRSLYIPRWKMIGGSTSMNAMIYIRGNPADYDGWERDGATGWSAEAVLPIFKRSEHNERGADHFHGTGGRLNVADLTAPNELTGRWVEAGKEAGLPFNPDFNGATQEGVGTYQVMQKNGARWSAADAFLTPAKKRRGLVVETGAMAHRLRIEAGRCVGVEYTRRGRHVSARATREVVVAAGAINTPQLLMLSGIGPADHLAEFGITTVVNNPSVGTHLMDHPVTVMSWRTSLTETLDIAEKPIHLFRYVAAKGGHLTSNVGEGGGFMRTTRGLPAPDMQFHFAPGYFQEHGFRSYDGHAFTIAPTLIGPTSRGTVRLRSADPGVRPAVLGGFLGEQPEMDAMVAGIEMARAIAASRPLQSVTVEELHPGADVASRPDVEGWIRRTAELLYHPSCTARMGRPEDSVVDPELRVYGLEGLRVADASVMPTLVRGNTAAPTMMVAERASELLLSAN